MAEDELLADMEALADDADAATAAHDRILQHRPLRAGIRLLIAHARERHQHDAELLDAFRLLRDSLRKLPLYPGPGERQFWSIGHKHRFDQAIARLWKFLESLGERPPPGL